MAKLVGPSACTVMLVELPVGGEARLCHDPAYEDADVSALAIACRPVAPYARPRSRVVTDSTPWDATRFGVVEVRPASDETGRWALLRYPLLPLMDARYHGGAVHIAPSFAITARQLVHARFVLNPAVALASTPVLELTVAVHHRGRCKE